MLIWKITIDKIIHNPLFGTGYGSFKEHYNYWQTEYFIENPTILDESFFSNYQIQEIAGQVKMPYNEYLEIFVEQGIVGLSFFLLITGLSIYKVYKSFIKTHFAEDIACIATTLSILIMAAFSYPFYSLPTFLLFFTILALSNRGNGKPSYILKINNVIFVSCSYLLIGIFIFSYCIDRIHTYKKYSSIKDEIIRYDIALAENEYKALLPKLNNNPDYLLNYALCLKANGKLKEAIYYLDIASTMDSNPIIHLTKGDILKELKKYSEAEKAYWKATLIVPSLIYPKYLLVKLYIESGNMDKAKELAEQIIKKRIKVTSFLADQIVTEMNFFVKRGELPSD